MKKILSILLAACMLLAAAVTTVSAVNCQTNTDVGYENSGYFFAQDARDKTVSVDAIKDTLYGDTPSFAYHATGNATEDNIGDYRDTKNWVYIGNGPTWADLEGIINQSNYVEGYFAWDADYLYFYIDQDLGSFKQNQNPDSMWMDYCIQIEFVDFKAATYSDWGCSVKASTGETMQYCFVNGGCVCPTGATNYNVKVTADGSSVSYEGAIPVSDFFSQTEIKEGATLGFNLCINFGNMSETGGKQKCLTWAQDNYHTRSGNSAIPITLLGPNTTIEDALRAQEEAEKMIADAAEQTDGAGILFAGCNNLNQVSGVTLNNETVKSGTGAWAFTLGSQMIEFKPEAVNGSKYDSLEFDLYIADGSKIEGLKTDNSFLELTSSGTCDSNEIAWKIDKILADAKEGWNHITLFFADAESTGGDIDLSAINFMRFFDVTKENNTDAVIDNIRLTDAKTQKDKKDSESLAKYERQSKAAYERESLRQWKEESESLHQAEIDSANATSAVGTETGNNNPETKSGEGSSGKGGCGSVLIAGSAIVVLCAAVGTAFVLRKKED